MEIKLLLHGQPFHEQIEVKIYKVLNNGTPGTLIADKAMSAGTHVYTLPNPVQRRK
jgi:hypothetical protein